MFAWILVILLSSASLPAAAEPISVAGKESAYGYDELIFLGWNNACSVAFQYFNYPPVGDGLRGVPDNWLVGRLTIDPGTVDVQTQWVDRGESSLAWDPNRVNKMTEELIRTGYAPAGTVETIREAPVYERAGLRHILHSTAAFQLGYLTKWPEPQFKLSEIHYSPLSNCAFMIFRNSWTPRDSYRYKLIRMLNPGVRRNRARAHVTNAIFLYKEKMDIYAAEEELSIAAEMDPEYPLALYHHAAMLSNHGRYEEALGRLEAAIKFKPEYAAKAQEDVEFERLWKDLRFHKIVGKRPLFPLFPRSEKTDE
ncbi:MAG: tetratricopeptide repeat protein [Elusimicrobiota bacterium]